MVAGGDGGQGRIGHIKVRHLDGKNLVAGTQARQGIHVIRMGIPVVQHDDDDAAAAQPSRSQIEQFRQIGFGSLQSASCIESREHVLDLRVTVGRSCHARPIRPWGDHRHIVAVTARYPRQHPDRREDHVSLALGECGRTRQRSASRYDEGEGVPTLRPVAFDQQLAGACRGLPVDVLDVITAHVGAQIVEV